MPATLFDKTAQQLSNITVHTLVSLESAVLEELRGEDFLLIQSCLRQGDGERLQEVDKEGNLVLDVHYNFRLRYAISAKVLAFDGLADYAHGRALDSRALDFANGRRAFQLEAGGKLVYLSPRQNLLGGDLPGLDFVVERIFVDLDEVGYPGVGAVSYVDLPDLSAGEMPGATLTAMLEDMFYGVAAFAAAGLEVALFDGDPAGAGVELMDANMTGAQWQDFEPGMTAAVTVGRNSGEVLWTTTTESARSCTHVRLRRNGLVIRDWALAEALAIPAGKAVRAPVGALAVQLTWPLAETGAVWSLGQPGCWMLQYVLGGARSGYLTDEFVVGLLDVDPGAGGAALTSWDTVAGSGNFTVSGLTVTFNTLSGVDAAPGGGWAVGWVQVVTSGNVLVLSEEHVLAVGAGVVPSLNGAPVLTLPGA